MFKPAAAPERAPVAEAAAVVPAAKLVEPALAAPAAESVPAAPVAKPAEPAPVAVSASAPAAPAAPTTPAQAIPAPEAASVPVTPVAQSVTAESSAVAPEAPSTDVQAATTTPAEAAVPDEAAAAEPPLMDEGAFAGLDDEAMIGLDDLGGEPDTQTVDFLDDPAFGAGRDFDPTLQADAQAAAVPVTPPAIPLDAFTPDHWVEVSAQLMKQGLDHHLLKDTEWIGCEEGTVMLKTPHKMLKQLAFVGTVQTLLSDYFQTPLKVLFVQGQTENTALEAERRAIIARQQKAEADAQQDRRVQQFIRTFNGKLCHDTVQPL